MTCPPRICLPRNAYVSNSKSNRSTICPTSVPHGVHPIPPITKKTVIPLTVPLIAPLLCPPRSKQKKVTINAASKSRAVDPQRLFLRALPLSLSQRTQYHSTYPFHNKVRSNPPELFPCCETQNARQQPGWVCHKQHAHETRGTELIAKSNRALSKTKNRRAEYNTQNKSTPCPPPPPHDIFAALSNYCCCITPEIITLNTCRLWINLMQKERIEVVYIVVGSSPNRPEDGPHNKKNGPAILYTCYQISTCPPPSPPKGKKNLKYIFFPKILEKKRRR